MMSIFSKIIQIKGMMGSKPRSNLIFAVLIKDKVVNTDFSFLVQKIMNYFTLIVIYIS